MSPVRFRGRVLSEGVKVGTIGWLEPTSVDEAVAFLADHDEGTWLIAGGTDLLVKMNLGLVKPEVLVDLSNIACLRGIEERGNWVRVGPTTTLTEVQTSPVIVNSFPVLAEAASKIGAVQVQNLGTIGGNICNAEPCADSAAACLSLNARVVVRGAEGERSFPLDEIFHSPGKTILSETDLLTDILIPRRPGRSGGAYEKFSLRKVMDQSLVAVGASVRLDEEGVRCEEVGIGMATVAPTPMRASRAESVLKGEEPTVERIREAAVVATQEARPRDSHKASAAYRRMLIQALTEKALKRAVEMARREGA